MVSKKFLVYWFPVIIYAAMIFIMSSMPKTLTESLYVFPHSDKVGHFFEYTIFGFLMIRALNSSARPRTNISLRTMAVLLCVLYAVTDEIHQHFIPSRSMEFADLISDGLGAFIGQIFFKARHQ